MLELKKIIPANELSFKEINKILIDNNINEKELKELFGLRQDEILPYNNPMFFFALDSVLFRFKKIVIKDNQISTFNDKFLKGIEFINSDKPPESLEDMAKMLDISKLKVLEYINQDKAFKKWYTSTLALKGLESFERVSKGAESETFGSSLGKGGHGWKANALALKFAKTDLLKEDNNKIDTQSSKKNYTFINFNQQQKDMQTIKATVIDSSAIPFEVSKNN